MTFTQITIGSAKVAEARTWLEQLAVLPEWANEVNSLAITSGRKPSGGLFLVSAEQVSSLSTTGYVSISWTFGTTTKTFSNYVVTECTQAIAADNSPYLVRVADVRQVYQYSAIAERYNVRLSVGDEYETDTLKAGTPYTWQELFADVRDKVSGAGIGAATLKSPTGTPENLLFDGLSAWDALHDICDVMDNGIAYDPFAGTTDAFALNDTQSGYNAQVAGLAKYQQSAPVAAGFSAPSTVRVFFNWRPGEGNSWTPKTPHAIDVATGIAGAHTGYHVAWGPMLAETNLENPSSSPINVAAMTTEAGKIAARIADQLSSEIEPTFYRFAGLHQFAPGAQVESVRWSVIEGGLTITEVRERGRIESSAGSKRYPRNTEPLSNSGYLVKVPADGIPAGTEAAPSATLCDLYWVNDAGDYESAVKTTGGQIAVSVLNHGDTIDYDPDHPYAPVIRDWQGEWNAISTTGTGGYDINFEIIEVSGSADIESSGDADDCANRDYDAPLEALVLVTRRPCGVSRVPQETDAMTVVVYDLEGSWLADREIQDLVGKTGRAKLMLDEGESGSADDVCKWMITFIDWWRWRVVMTDIEWIAGVPNKIYERHLVWDHCKLPPVPMDVYECPTTSSSSGS